ncbi:hypothetical protein TNCV_2017021 [Trichonephila clavipes]|nr:hypothetical protein TNCV_2017021 [Trichonephila clavipes]
MGWYPLWMLPHFKVNIVLTRAKSRIEPPKPGIAGSSPTECTKCYGRGTYNEILILICVGCIYSMLGTVGFLKGVPEKPIKMLYLHCEAAEQ